LRKPPLRIEQILQWADAHHRRTGQWPRIHSGEIAAAPWETWSRVHDALARGLRTLPRRYTLARLLVERRGARVHLYEPRLTQRQILAWADAHHRHSGQWPGQLSGPIRGTSGESWSAIDQALHLGARGLPGGESLAELLYRARGVRNKSRPPHLTLKQILSWADAWHGRTGQWPRHKSGPIPGSDGETWLSIDKALRSGARGLGECSSLANLLEMRRGVSNRLHVPRLSEDLILTWADDYFRRTGRWPTEAAGRVPAAPRESWENLSICLRIGVRGLPGGDTLARLLQRRRGARNVQRLRRLTARQILAWADAQHARTGRWPSVNSGPVLDAPGEKWANLNAVLYTGGRGLPGGDSLARLLGRYRGVYQSVNRPTLTVAQILSWADAHYRRYGRWPGVTSGAVAGADGENWRAINQSPTRGGRGLPAGRSLARLLKRRRRLLSRRRR
jgi:hypothetical protein